MSSLAKAFMTKKNPHFASTKRGPLQIEGEERNDTEKNKTAMKTNQKTIGFVTITYGNRSVDKPH